MIAGIEHIEAGEIEKARNCFHTAVKKNETDDISNHWLGVILGKLGESEQAVVYLKRAIEYSDDVQVKS